MEFSIIGNQFVRDGKPIKIISGAVHYFRNMPDTWDDIFDKMRALGLNCVETYTAWNMHEPKPGEFSFEGRLDIVGFIQKAMQHDLMVIVRPGPYICAEWEFGGLPWWLQNEKDIEIRCMNETYIKYFDRYLDVLFDKIRPLLSTNGGPIIMIQCENEYGSYGDDKEYLKYLRDGYRKRGIDVPLFTSDGCDEPSLLDGNIDGCYPMLNFGSGVEEKFTVHDRLYPNHPKMCMEMWDGWFDAWGDEIHHTTPAKDYAKTVDDMLKKGSVNIYMFMGGTNFGFTNGANHFEKYAPQVTSYDYDALLTECGDITPKYLAVREVIKKYSDEDLPDIPKNREKASYGTITLDRTAGLFDNLLRLSAPIKSNVPRPMEEYGTGYGYILYETQLNRDYVDAVLSFESIGDRAIVYVNNVWQGVVYVNDETLSLKINAKSGDKLYILVENLGRVNFGSKMMRKKGIAGRLLIDNRIHFSWNVYPLEMNNTDNVIYANEDIKAGFFKGEFNVEHIADTFLSLDNFTKGFVIINGFNIGRYWDIGPQKTLYVPSSILKQGRNEIVVFESDGIKGKKEVYSTDKHNIGMYPC